MTPEEFKAQGIPQPSTYSLWLKYFEREGHVVRPEPQNYYLLITGSREASPAMLTCARRAVWRACQQGWQIIVGDAEGVDEHVLYCCQQFAVPFVCYGITPEPRTPLGAANYKRVKGDYLVRDRAMVKVADRAFAIWNGVSRGTKYTYDQALKARIPADIRTFEVA